MTKSLWQPPRLRTAGENEEERRATWLELFYDLVFVAAIAEVAHNLHGHLSLTGFLGYVLLFVPIWWSWVGATFYATRFDTDDLGHRLLTLLQMVAIAVLAVNSKTEIILPSAERWLLCGSVAICLIFLAVIHFITCTLGTTQRRKILAAYRLGAAAFILILAIAGVNLSPLVLMALVALACAVQVVLALLGSPQNN